MKKILQILCLCLVAYVAKAQDQSQHQLFVGNAAVDYSNTTNNLQMQMQIGSPIFSSLNTGVFQARVGFPYGILYISPTFVVAGFEVSKGYYTDRVNIKWAFGANQALIEKINIYRKELGSATPMQLISSVSKDVFEYNDTQTQGGVLYEYRIEAVGVSVIEELYATYIEGVGFRSPTATVSGSISFDGGSPVQDVIVFAEANGADNNSGSSLQFTGAGSANIENIEYDIPTNQLTLQSWLSSAGDIFKFITQKNKEVKIYAGKSESSKIEFVVSVDGTVIQTAALNNAYPTGKLDPLGNDIFQDIDSLTTSSFIHISTILEENKAAKFYINGRELTSAYIDAATIREGYKTPNLEATTVENYATLADDKVERVFLAENYTGYIDEVRIWQRALPAEEIRRDYRRYISGGERGLSIYLRMDEKEGTNVYDFSKKGFRQNKNDGYFVSGVTFSSVTPTSQQLGVFGVTDANGSYIISSIGYSGTGESFVITPSFGVHEFEPASQSLFLGAEASVVNQLNFKDISSFKFSGKAVYNTQGVFNSVAVTKYLQIEDYGYNQYKAIDTDIKTSVIINKGQYYYEGGAIDTLDNFYKGGALRKYKVVIVENAYVYIDGTIVIGTNNQPVQTDNTGKFTINVPIGDHKVEVRKDGHTFAHSGYFPASDTFEFFEDQIEDTWFIDTTRISLVGRVVGGRIESDKPIGFGLDGAFSYLNNEGEENAETERISSKNNIGIATIILKGDVETIDLDVSVATDSITGEYKVSLIPYIYKIKPDDLKVPSNPALNGKFLTVNEEVNLLATPVLDSISYTTKDGTELFSEAFHHQKSFRYNSPTTLRLISQEFENEYTIGDDVFDVSELAVPLYLQNSDYSMVFEVTQNYINLDNVDNLETKEYYNEGRFEFNNNLATAADDRIQFATQAGVEQYLYTFRASNVNASHDGDFQNNIDIQYILANKESIGIENTDDFKGDGVVVGAIEPEGTVFVTVAPEVPDIILRDPPGSNSFASIEQGTTISFQKSNSASEEGSVGAGLYVSLLPNFKSTAGTPFFSVDTELEPVGTIDANFSKSQQLNQDGSSTETYTFNKTISTSDDPLNVGAGADVYVGNAKNEYYGICNNMFITTTIPELKDNTVVPYINVKDADNNDLYLSFQKVHFIAEQPTNTFFIYTQNHIIETLIPSLTDKASNAPETVATTSDDPDAPKTRQFYMDQVALWQKIIQDNERDKYLALNDRATLKAELLAEIARKNAERDQRRSELNDLPFILQRAYTLTEFDTHQAALNSLMTDNFETTISFDAGVGAYTSSVGTSIITAKSYTKTIDLSTDFLGQLGLLVNDAGAVASITGTSSSVDETGFSTDMDVTTTISYTLKDNDEDNFLAVDVVNLFNGSAPIFITKGGATSCPNEPVTVSEYYDHANFNETVVGDGGEELNAGTVSVYRPEISVEGASTLTNIPESEGALFMLTLKNMSETETDLIYTIGVNAITLNGATTNIAPNGVDISLPYDTTIEFPFEVYKSSASSTFEYDAIEVYLKSPCLDAYVSVNVSVDFKPSCSKVAISAPQDNWVFNRAEGYATVTSNDITTITENKLPITFTDFNTDFAGFEKIELQYRNASSANWTKFKTYYGTEDLKDTAGDLSGVVIDPAASEYTFEWDVIGNQVPDGNYELRAISYCTSNVTNVSPIIQGVVNLNSPVLFGTPQPTDGILDVGEDISLRFNEDVYMNGDAANFVELTGLQNQQEIDHSVSVYLDGGANTIELPNQILPNGEFTIQFWYKNATTATGNLILQENGINASLNGNELTFSVEGASVTATIDSSQYNFYSLVYQTGTDPQLLIFENGSELKTNLLTSDLDISSNSSIFIGGPNVIGTIHDLRFWSKIFTPAQATVAKDKTLTGRELNLLGYWTLDEGHGKVGIDKAKSRNATVNLGWDIKPKGTGYTFANDAYLSLENVGFVQPSVAEDITLSFWIKTTTASAGTIFSNGKGNSEDPLQTNGFRNKWSVNIKSDGNLELMSENTSYNLTTQSIADGAWHHVALVVKRGGSINTYVDALETSSVSSVNIGGISGNKILIGARLYEDFSSTETIDNHFTGNLDEIRLWNTARSFEQIKRDRYFEIDAFSAGLMLYTDFNQEDGNTDKGPKYSHLIAFDPITGIDRSSTFSILGGTTAQSYTQDSPALKPKLKFTNIPFTTVINGDQMIIQPALTAEAWSLFEGEILNFSVSDMTDEHFNKQISPITWSAFVSKQEIEWFTINQTKEIVAEKKVNETYSFTMDIVNKGGSNQPYTISGLPSWITVQNVSGSVAPNATKQVNFIVDAELSMGTYNADIYLETASEFNDRLTLDLRVLTPAPDWSVNAPDYSNSMNVIGKIKINEIFSRDQFTKVGAFVNDTPRGEAYLKYDTAYDSYFVYLTAYSNVTSGEEITFKIWDAVNGKVLIASIDGAANTSFLQNEILGSKSSPVLFSGAQFSEQTLALNEGWTWTSFYVEDDRFNNVKATFDGLVLQDNDQIKSQNEFTRFENNDWFGSLTTIANTKMYKLKLATANSLILIGNDVDEANVNLAINEGWNWLPYPIHRNISIEEALSFYNPSDGDVIKDQYTFAIYDASSGWSGTLNYMQSNRGYMMKSGASQTLNYPNSENAARSNYQGQEHSAETIALFSKYNANMSVVAEVIADEKYSKVLVYDVEDNLRGASPIVSFGDKKFSFISVFSTANDLLRFVVSDDTNEVDATSSFVFENNKVFGNIQEPVILNLKSLSTGDLFLSNVVLYPNPFSNAIIINSSQQTEKVTKIEIYSTIGTLIRTVVTKTDKTTIDTSNLANGIYLIKVTSSNGKHIIKKMVKK